MKNALVEMSSRRTVISRLLAAMAVAPVTQMTLVGTVHATKKGKNTIASVKDRVYNARLACEVNGGGKLDVRSLPSGTQITYCEGGTYGGTRCKHTQDATTCTCTNTGTDGWCPPVSTNPGEPGVADPPTGGVLEDPGSPTGGVAGFSGGEAARSGRSARQTKRKRARRKQRR